MTIGFRRGLSLARCCRKVKIPQVDFFGFGEKLPVVEQGISDPSGMGYVYDLVAHVLEDDFQTAHKILGLRERVSDGSRRARRPEPREGYGWDLYVSHQSSSYLSKGLERIIELLRAELSLETGSDATIFWNRQEVVLGNAWPDELKNVLRHSRLLLPILTPAYFQSTWNVAEWRTFEERERLAGARDSLILPLLFRGAPDSFPHFAQTRQFTDMREFLPAPQRVTRKLERTIRILAERIASMLSEVPPFTPDFPVIDPAEVHIEIGGSPSLPRLGL